MERAQYQMTILVLLLLLSFDNSLSRWCIMFILWENPIRTKPKKSFQANFKGLLVSNI